MKRFLILLLPLLSFLFSQQTTLVIPYNLAVKKRVDLSVSGSSIFQDSGTAPDIIPALTDIKIRIEEVSANNAGIFATLDIMLVDESAFTYAYLSAIGQVGY